MKLAERLVSIDALRGLDMFFIIGGAGLVSSLSRLLSGSEATGLSEQMRHVPWAGLHVFDVIFPLFLFVSGVTFPFSTAARLANGETRFGILRNIVRRMLLLIALGAVYGHLFAFDWSSFRVWSVIGRIGIVWAAAAVMTLFLSRRLVALAVAGILTGWWLFLWLVPAPGTAAGVSGLSGPQSCFACWFDAQYLTTAHRFEGGLATIAMIPTAVFGMWAGEWLRSGRRLRLMIPIGAFLIAVGWLWSLPAWGCPIVKDIWSGSFALVTGGISLCLLWAFHEVIDVRGWRVWAMPFTVIGVNAIAIYVSDAFVPYAQIGKFFFGALIPLVDAPAWKDLVLAGGKLCVEWVCLVFLFRRRIFFKV